MVCSARVTSKVLELVRRQSFPARGPSGRQKGSTPA